MDTVYTRESLHVLFSQIAEDFKKVQENIDKHEQATRKCTEDLSHIAENPPSIRQGHPLEKILKSAQKNLIDSVQLWQEAIKTYTKNTSFRKEYGDSLLLYVFGQVKCGKSSLSNLLIHGHHDPKPFEIFPNVRATMYDDSGKQNTSKEEFERDKKFKVDFIEATSAIQVLSIPGLTLVDSPGIHSATKENGNLAQDYLDCADLVLFMTNHKSVCTRSEAAEIHNIHEKKKNFLVLVPRCDNVDEDEDAEGNIIQSLTMKSDSDRKKLKDWCVKSITTESQITDKYLVDKILTISCYYAEENPSEVGWKDSGLGALTGALACTAQSQRLCSKREVPLNNLFVYNENIIKSIAEPNKVISDVIDSIKTFRDAGAEAAQNAVRKLEQGIRGLVIDAVNKHTNDGTAIKKAIERGLPPIMDSNFHNFATSINAAGEKLVLALREASVPVAAMDFPSVKDICHVETFYVKRSKWGGLVGAVAGGIAGFFTPVPGGTAIGIMVGGEAGARLGGGNRSVTTVVGDTRDEVINNAITMIIESARPEFMRYCATIVSDEIETLEKWSEKLHDLFVNTKHSIMAQNKAISEQLANINSKV